MHGIFHLHQPEEVSNNVIATDIQTTHVLQLNFAIEDGNDMSRTVAKGNDQGVRYLKENPLNLRVLKCLESVHLLSLLLVMLPAVKGIDSVADCWNAIAFEEQFVHILAAKVGIGQSLR